LAPLEEDAERVDREWTPSGFMAETPRGFSYIQAYPENHILLVSLEEDAERVG
tara:strand:- start:549 stop:707 length:159 start_codon:yes stop_codon:yes gene_type:complete